MRIIKLDAIAGDESLSQSLKKLVQKVVANVEAVEARGGSFYGIAPKGWPKDCEFVMGDGNVASSLSAFTAAELGDFVAMVKALSDVEKGAPFMLVYDNKSHFPKKTAMIVGETANSTKEQRVFLLAPATIGGH